MVHQPENPLAAGGGLQGAADGRNVNGQCIERRSRGACVAVILEIKQSDRGVLPGLPAVDILLKLDGIMKIPSDVRNEVGLERVDVNQAQVIGFNDVEFK